MCPEYFWKGNGDSGGLLGGKIGGWGARGRETGFSPLYYEPCAFIHFFKNYATNSFLKISSSL